MWHHLVPYTNNNPLFPLSPFKFLFVTNFEIKMKLKGTWCDPHYVILDLWWNVKTFEKCTEMAQNKGRTIRKLMEEGGGAKYKKIYSRKGKLNENNSWTPINSKKYSCYGQKKIQTRKFRLFTVLYFSVRSSRSSALRFGLLHECRNYSGSRGRLRGSEKNRGNVITYFSSRSGGVTGISHAFYHSLIKKLRWRWKTCQTHLASINVISDEWACEEGRNKYFDGTRYNRAWVLGRVHHG